MSIAGPDYQPSLESCSAQAVPWSLLELQLRCARGDLNLAEDEGGGVAALLLHHHIYLQSLSPKIPEKGCHKFTENISCIE